MIRQVSIKQYVIYLLLLFPKKQKNQSCNCEELKKKLDLLTNELENLQKIKSNLENNLSSLLKTAKAEIVRKDKMISDLRKRYDIVFLYCNCIVYKLSYR